MKEKGEAFEMFQVGDQVVYGMHGVCVISGVEERTIDRKAIQYFVLTPVERTDAQYYVPMHNEAALSKMRPVITKEELNDMLESDAVTQDSWIADENLRKQRYKELITGGDRVALVQMVRSLHQHKKMQYAAGRKFHLCDENFLRDAEKLLGSEFSLVLQMSQEEVGAYMRNALKDE